jgi:hypothetical protein
MFYACMHCLFLLPVNQLELGTATPENIFFPYTNLTFFVMFTAVGQIFVTGRISASFSCRIFVFGQNMKIRFRSITKYIRYSVKNGPVLNIIPELLVFPMLPLCLPSRIFRRDTWRMAARGLRRYLWRHDSHIDTMGGLVISRAEWRAISARRRKPAHFNVISTVLCTGYVVNKTVSCVLRNGILVTMI